MPIVSCRICNKEFYGKPNHIKLGYCKYCSKGCQAEAQRTGGYRDCFICGKKIWRALQYLKRSKSGKFFCSKSCQTIWRNQFYTGERHWNYKLGHAIEYRNLMKRLKVPEVCNRCKGADHRVLAVHHVDKNRANNSASNLIYLCMNCHFLVHKYDESCK